MRSHTPVLFALSGAVLLTAAGLTPALAQKGQPVTLRLLIQDQQGRQSEAAAADLVAFAADVSDGALTIVPTFDGGDVAAAVKAGETELGMVPSRDWDAAGVTSLDVLEAPFLIDDDALAVAVATSDIAERAMAGLEAVGVTGLGMWPEDQRHLFAFDASGKVFQTPADVAGSPILVVAGTPGVDLIRMLDGVVWQEGLPSGDMTGDRGIDAEAGTLHGMVTGLWGAGLPTTAVTVAGDVTLYAKYQMLVGNSAALDALTPDQRELLDQAVEQMHQAAVGRHLAEADLAADLCSAGGTVIEAGPDALAAFVDAAKPLTDALAADPVTGPLMADVQSLKDATPRAPGAGTCAPAQAEPSLDPAAQAGWIGDRPVPNGVYRITVTAEQLQERGSSAQDAGMNAGIWTWTFGDGTWSADLDGGRATCHGTSEVADGMVSLYDVPGTTCSLGYDLRWRPDGDGILFQILDLNWMKATPAALAAERAVVELHWTRIGDPMPSIAPSEPAFIGDQVVPAGTYRMSVTTDELEAAGATRDYAGLNRGTWTWTFTQDGWSAAHDVRNERCSGGMTVVDGHVELTDVFDGNCGMGYQLRWRLEGDGIRFDLVGLTAGPETPITLANEGAFIGRVWSRAQ